MKTLNFKRFERKYNFENSTMNESDLQRVYNYKIQARGSITTTIKGFVNIDDGRLGGAHWTCFYIKDKKSICLDSVGGQPDKFLLNHLPKPITYLN